MKKMILSLILVFVLFILVGCGMQRSAKDAVIEYLEMYRTKNEIIMDELDEYVDNENLSDEQKKLYKEILEREYSTLMYEVVSEQYDGNTAFITTEITVIDLFKEQRDAMTYFNSNQTLFNDEDGEYDNSLYMDYKLDKMSEATDTVTYTIDIKVEKDGDIWKVVQLSNESLEKLHGVYNYDEEE